MQTKKIIGVRNIGKVSEADPMYRSGTIWQPGQTINMSLALAEPLLSRHFDLFEEAPVDPNATTVLSVPGSASPRPVASIPNINSMTPDGVRQFARIELGATIDPSVPDSDIHRVALNMMLDRDETTPKNSRHMVEFPLTDEEYFALHSGVVELRLVPVVVDTTEPSEGSLEAELAALSGAELKAYADEHGVKINGTWGDPRRRIEIAKALSGGTEA